MPECLELYDKDGSVQRVIYFLVTSPIFSWVGVQGFMYKEFAVCMTMEDLKSAKKYICAGELARVFKNMISLFLTTSYVLLRIKQTATSSTGSGTEESGGAASD